jgi:predicted metal-dependent peptidase
MANNKKGAAPDMAKVNFNRGCHILSRQPIFYSLYCRANILRQSRNMACSQSWAVVTSNGTIYVNPTRRASPEEWVYVLAHCLLHLGFGHFQKRSHPHEWNAACNYFVGQFLADLKLGSIPDEYVFPNHLSKRNEESLYQEFCERGIPGYDFLDMIIEPPPKYLYQKTDWQVLFGEGLTSAVTNAVNIAAGRDLEEVGQSLKNTLAQRAKSWFISNYPLLGALAASFEIIEDPLICQRLDISVAAVSVESQQIFINPAAGLKEEECRFVMAHELLHVGLRHDTRCLGRDPYLWNVACDYIINSWLLEMDVGELPNIGGLHDPALKGLSAETVYDIITKDLRLYRKLATLRGIGQSDILDPQKSGWWNLGAGMDLDAFYRRCLSQGLVYHQEQGRGLLPAGLIEEIKALSYPPIPWDVELAQWFDDHFSPLVKVRSYARTSRRQSATPDIPRPCYVPDSHDPEGRTFGVVLDTSGSMDSRLLGQALGAIASYSISHDVSFVRVVFCDAFAYDQGYMVPEALAQRVKVKGRGGTVLQPGIDLLEKSQDFPKNGPLLIITDGYCDNLHIRREHAFLIPLGRQLPFIPKGQVFKIK